eukprot:583698-Ditylum_brightwellii.AAC.1
MHVRKYVLVSSAIVQQGQDSIALPEYFWPCKVCLEFYCAPHVTQTSIDLSGDHLPTDVELCATH